LVEVDANLTGCFHLELLKGLLCLLVCHFDSPSSARRHRLASSADARRGVNIFIYFQERFCSRACRCFALRIYCVPQCRRYDWQFYVNKTAQSFSDILPWLIQTKD
jgi:hypothetical protein